MRQTGLAASVLFSLGICALSAPAQAFEDTSVIMPGASLMDPTGAAPPPGWYVEETFTYFNLAIVNQSGKKIGVTTTEGDINNQVIWVPKLPTILGASYFVYVVEPVRGGNLSVPGLGNLTAVGMENTVISPLNLSWNLHNGFFVSAGVTFYAPDGTYKAGNVYNISRNYFSAEFDGAVSYLADGWNLTWRTAFDVSATNPYNGYHSGAGFVTDITALKEFGKFELGGVASWTQQIENDSIHGVTVAASGANGFGNRASVFEIGPAISTKIGIAKVSAYYMHDVEGANYAYGDRYYLKLFVPLLVDAETPAPVKAKY